MTIAWIAAALLEWTTEIDLFSGIDVGDSLVECVCNDESIWIKLLNFGPDHVLQSELKLNVNCKMKF